MEEKFSVQDIKSRIFKDSNGISNYIHVSIEEMDWLVEKVEVQQQEILRYKEALSRIAFDSEVQFFERCPDVAKSALGNKR